MEYKVTNIQWDTDNEPIELPTELTVNVPDNVEGIEDYISDEISNITGFCHLGFSVN